MPVPDSQLFLRHDCKHEFTPAQSISPLRIFLSYGHDTNEELVRRIKANLEKRGHDVWFDKSEIKAGDDWRRSITEGIAKCCAAARRCAGLTTFFRIQPPTPGSSQRIRQHLLEFAVLTFQPFQPPGFIYLHVPKLLLPPVERHLRDVLLSAELLDAFLAAICFPQYP